MTVKHPTTALPAGYRLEEYAIQRVLAHGGFGITYLAQDTRLSAHVAIKEYFPRAFALRDRSFTIRPLATDSGESDYQWGLQAFLKEARALAKFKHNHIVRVLRFLEANGTAYMVMEYEEGESLAAFLPLQSGRLIEPMLLKIFLPILSGLQAVHDAGILHLDIKPGNIYLRRDGHPMLIDFGSARQVRSGSSTDQKTALTPGYAAPEQYPGLGGQIGTWSDVYAVGATLYRCVTGQEPLDARARLQTIAHGKIDPLVPAAKLDRPHYAQQVRDTIDAALRLKPTERPRSVLAIQNGLMGKGLLEDKPSVRTTFGSGFIGIARTVAVTTTTRVRRSPLEAAVALIVLVATFAVVTPKILIDSGRMTEAELYDLFDTAIQRTVATANEVRLFIDAELFGRQVRQPPPQSVAPGPRPLPRPAGRGVVPVFSVDRTILATYTVEAPANAMAFLRGGSVLVVATTDGKIRAWQTDSGELLQSFHTGAPTAPVIAVSPDGRWLALATPTHAVRLLDANHFAVQGELAGHSADITALAFSPDSRMVVSAGRDGSVILWDLDRRERIAELLRSDESEVAALAFSPNGRLLAAGDDLGGVRYWEMTTVSELLYTSLETARITALAFAPDSRWLAVAGDGGFLKLLRVGIGREERRLEGAPTTMHTLVFSPDGKWLLAPGTRGTIALWEIVNGNAGTPLAGHDHHVAALALSGDGRLLASGGDDRTVKIWK